VVSILACSAPCFAGESADAPKASGYDLILALDFSRSALRHDPIDMRSLVPSLVLAQLESRPGDRVAIVPVAGWNETDAANMRVLLNWTEIPADSARRTETIKNIHKLMEGKFVPFGRATDYNRACDEIIKLLESREKTGNRPWLLIVSDGQMDVIEANVRPDYETDARKRYGKENRETVNKAAFDTFMENILPRLAAVPDLRLTLINTDPGGKPSPVFDAIKKTFRNHTAPKSESELVSEIVRGLSPSKDEPPYPLATSTTGTAGAEETIEVPFHMHQGTRELTLVLSAVRGNFQFEILGPGRKKKTPADEPGLSWHSPTKRYITLKMREMQWGDYNLKLYNVGDTEFEFNLQILGMLDYRTLLQLPARPKSYYSGQDVIARFALTDYAGKVVTDPLVVPVFSPEFALTPPGKTGPQPLQLPAPTGKLDYRYKYAIPRDMLPGTGVFRGRFTAGLNEPDRSLTYVTAEKNASFTVVCEASANFAGPSEKTVPGRPVMLVAAVKGTFKADEFPVQLADSSGEYKASVRMKRDASDQSGKTFKGEIKFYGDRTWKIGEQDVFEGGKALLHIVPGRPDTVEVAGSKQQFYVAILMKNIPWLVAIGVLLFIWILLPRFGKQFFGILDPEDETQIASTHPLRTLPKKFGLMPARLGPPETGGALLVTCRGIRGASSNGLSTADSRNFEVSVAGNPIQGKHRLRHLDEILVENKTDGSQMRVYFFEREPSEDEILSLSGKPLADDEIILVDEGLKILA
jgi:hypothetical protein